MTRGVVRVIALHGFLGRAADWDVLRPVLPGADVQAVDLWHLLEETGAADWEGVGGALDGCLRRVSRAGGGRRAEGDRPTVLVAYSFGGRLALASQELAHGRLPLAGVCLVSCHPGMPDDDLDARAARREADEGWAQRLLNAPAPDVWSAWNAQPVLAAPGGATRGGRTHHAAALPVSRATLAHAMRSFSLAGQPDFRPRLRDWRTPLLWVTGEADARFGALADGLAGEGVPALFARCPRAGHRVPWDNPEGFAAILQSWLDHLDQITQSPNHPIKSTNQQITKSPNDVDQH